MSTLHALYYPLKPGSEEKVKELFRLGARPPSVIRGEDGSEVGRLLGTMVFVGRELAVRVIEIEGPLGLVAAHMSRQEGVKAFERELAEHLAIPRAESPQAAREFFRNAAMECVVSRRFDDEE
ncbi:SchA/CurD-like domain-containing protein [Micromonospora sp. NPDC049559]|uniref:SchA/CurD-like domain-containing protein n=1 Tax=Micromonospora sp. NPDC049559 TaxID=3155923 RepID=UPI00344172D8